MYSSPDDPIIVGRVPLLASSLASRVLSASEPLVELAGVLREHPIALTALHVASPALHEAALAWLEGTTPKNRRAPLRLLAYFLRMAARPTPLLLCASVGDVALGAQTTLALEGDGSLRTRTRPDMAWLLAFVGAIEGDPELRRRLIVFESDAVLERAGRLYVAKAEATDNPCACATCKRQRITKVVRSTPMSLLSTPLVERVRHLCRGGIAVHRLIDELTREAELPYQRGEVIVNELWHSGLLVSSLRPPFVGDPVEHVARELRAVLPEAALRLDAIRRRMAALDATPVPRRSVAEYRAIERDLEALHRSPRVALHVDLSRRFSGALGPEILREAERLADVYARCSASVRLDRFRERFKARYGDAGRLVPLLETAHPDFGVGAPPESVQTKREEEGQQSRQAALLALAQRAIRDRLLAIEIDGATLDACLPPMPQPQELPPSMEVAFQVAAASAEALRAGAFTVSAAALHGSAIVGTNVARFVDLLGPAVGERLRRQLECEHAEVEPLVELTYHPTTPHMANVEVHPRLTPYEIRAGGSPGSKDDAHVLPFSDLAIGLEGDRLHLYSRRLGRRIRPVHIYPLNHTELTAGISRVLAFVAADGTRAVTGFDWGVASALPFLPRLRMGRLMVSLARWLLPPETIEGPAAPVWDRIQRWRTEWSVPRYVRMTTGESEILLDLDARISIDVLLDQLQDRGKHVRVQEVYPALDETWLKGEGEPYLCEFLVGMRRSRSRGGVTLGAPCPAVAAETPQPLLPASLDVALYAGFGRQPLVLRGPVRAALDDLQARGVLRRWFFSRYAAPQAHIRLQLRLAPERFPEERERLMRLFGRWANEGIVDWATVEPYRPPPSRDGERSTAAIEDILAVSCGLALNSLSAERGQGLDEGPCRLDPHCLDPTEHRETRERLRRCLITLDDIIDGLFPGELISEWLNGTRPVERKAADEEQRQDVKEIREAIVERRALPAVATAILEACRALRALEAEGALERPLVDLVRDVVRAHCARFALDPESPDDALRLQWNVYFSLSRMERASRRS
ncbi:MAG: lantibiotic dehydratase [bacterium]|nr:lantibiotic dehydratase [bacterium]